MTRRFTIKRVGPLILFFLGKRTVELKVRVLSGWQSIPTLHDRCHHCAISLHAMLNRLGYLRPLKSAYTLMR